jgi:hypothetical protein
MKFDKEPRSQSPEISETMKKVLKQREWGLKALQEEFPWMEFGAKFKLKSGSPKPLEGLYKDEIKKKDYTGRTFQAFNFIRENPKSKEVVLEAITPEKFTWKGKEKTTQVGFVFTLEELKKLGIEQVKNKE